ncbi:hypothetical protein V6N12_060574 [Hibiscus sabdariffa]|uniref:Uncharacterized protein n=1 Tax=Hibiscus sabdariffa TaxID=183260 RepID=A0ABR2D4W1_9ROSI
MSVSPRFSAEGVGGIGQLNGRPPDETDQVGATRVLERLVAPVDPTDVRTPKKQKDSSQDLVIDDGRSKTGDGLEVPARASPPKGVASYAQVLLQA